MLKQILFFYFILLLLLFFNVEDKATYNHLSQIPQKWELCVVVTTFFRPSIHQNNIATTSKLPTSVKFIPDLSLSLSLSLSHTHTHLLHIHKNYNPFHSKIHLITLHHRNFITHQSATVTHPQNHHILSNIPLTSHTIHNPFHSKIHQIKTHQSPTHTHTHTHKSIIYNPITH